jgi:hypothetical protein
MATDEQSFPSIPWSGIPPPHIVVATPVRVNWRASARPSADGRLIKAEWHGATIG